jgi:hypothetical protein
MIVLTLQILTEISGWSNRDQHAQFKLEPFLPPDTRRSSLDAALFDEDWRLRDGWTCENMEGSFVFKNKGDMDGPGITHRQLTRYRQIRRGGITPAPRRGGSLFG